MKFLTSFSLVVLATVAIGGCLRGEPEEIPLDDEGASSSSMESSAAVRENVTYQGRLEEAGISIYQEGTHRLILDDGSFVLLQSLTEDLGSYEGQTVEIQGDERDTVEPGGVVVDVYSITAVSASDSSASSDASVSAEQSSAGSAASVAPRSSALSSVVAPDDTTDADDTPATADAALSARVQAMAAYKADAQSMSQEYCSSHVGFCFPVPGKAWWKSFGATTSSLWHVEVSSDEILELGDGPLAVNLQTGGLDSLGVSDGQVVSRDDAVIGYRSWTNNRHFEVVAPTALRHLVEYVTANLKVSGDGSQ